MKTARIAPSRRFSALSTASGLAMSAMIATPALAQDADQDEGTEEAVPADEGNIIIVDGFRKSLENAQNIKRDADTFVDAVTAEDIGALPDRSVAETLQRIPGVNIGRFEKTSDPDRFSVEGTGVIVRGLPFVRSELNGRDIFSATGGRVLSFNDVSPELLGRVEVFKNVTADMIDGGIAGTVNLVTRKPLDNRGTRLSGSIEGTVGDLAEEWTGGFSVLGSTTMDTDNGSLGLQLGYTQSKLTSRTDASQVSDPCYRAPTLDGACLRAQTVVDGGFQGGANFDASNFPPAGAVVVPKGAGVRTTDLERDRQAWSAVLQYESPARDFLLTFEWLRSETEFFTDETSLLAQVNDDALFPVEAAGSTWQFDENGIFQSGVLSQRIGDAYANPFGRGGIPLEALRFQRQTEATTQDFSLDIDWEISDRFRINFEAQSIESDLSRDSVIGAMNTWANIDLDLSGRTPQVNFVAPPGAEADYFASGANSYYWFLLDSVERNEGDLESYRFDAEYDISDEGFFKSARFGARWAERDRTTRDTNFSTWGNLSAPWAGRAGCAPWGAGPGCFQGAGPFVPSWAGFTPGRYYTGLPGQENAISGGVFTDEFPSASNLRNPFGDDFQRGNAPAPLPGGVFFFGGDDLLGEYLAGTSKQQAEAINTLSQTPNPFFGVRGRQFTDAVTGEVTACDPFCPPEVSQVTEATKAAYGRIDFGTDFGNGWILDGNFGVRYVETEVKSDGLIGFPNPFFFDTGNGNGDGVVQVSEINQACTTAPPPLPGYCSLSDARKAEFAALHTGEIITLDQTINFDHWLPSFNARLDTGGGLLFRAAVSKGISRPDLQLFRAGGGIGDNTNALRDAGQAALDNGPLFAIDTGFRGLRPTESWNYDLSAEWYFDDVGSLTLSGFVKDIDGIVNTTVPIVTYTSPSGVNLEAETRRPDNVLDGSLRGFEIGYQQTYDFLPAPLDGLGFAGTYTYIDGGDFVNANLDANQGIFSELQPLAGISEHTVNATIFYEKGPLSARAAYNWRSEFLITARDDIFPYSPIWQEATGQLDASIFFSVTDYLKLGVQGVNLLDEVTETSQVIDFDGTRVTRSAFRNDRRFTFLARFDF
ncbi:TonB-dependent receptor [Erythrobacter sp. F6033]|uniref:TonB-dependent receptor n=1 Tax=Erythrobacter sp. F6033 TaxID=2926401 RepID=UPI001FF64BE6|nr:TonB-dependent receptor [Erythrobacter sp. F6033]MCK0127372.1 TonB-dependent receptor [Erythrobacter sp. F6033]